MALPAKPMTGRIESPKKMAVAPLESFAKARKPFIAASIAAIDLEGHGAKGVSAGSVPERHDSPEKEREGRGKLEEIRLPLPRHVPAAMAGFNPVQRPRR